MGVALFYFNQVLFKFYLKDKNTKLHFNVCTEYADMHDLCNKSNYNCLIYFIFTHKHNFFGKVLEGQFFSTTIPHYQGGMVE